MLTIRPKVAEMAFHVFGRALHPELFQVFRSQQITRSRYEAKIEITHDGHLVTWTCDSVKLTEVACSAQQLLPQRRQLFGDRLRGKCTQTFDAARGAKYTTEFELEQVGPDVFWMVQEQLSGQHQEHDLIQNFDSSGRIALGAVSFIHVESREKSLIVQALHTFPDDYAIVKSFSTFSAGKG